MKREIKSCNVVNFHLFGIRSSNIHRNQESLCARASILPHNAVAAQKFGFSLLISHSFCFFYCYFFFFFCSLNNFLCFFFSSFIPFFPHLCSMHVSMCLTTILRPRLGTWNADKLNESIYTTSNEIHCASGTLYTPTKTKYI